MSLKRTGNANIVITNRFISRAGRFPSTLAFTIIASAWVTALLILRTIHFYAFSFCVVQHISIIAFDQRTFRFTSITSSTFHIWILDTTIRAFCPATIERIAHFALPVFQHVSIITRRRFAPILSTLHACRIRNTRRRTLLITTATMRIVVTIIYLATICYIVVAISITIFTLNCIIIAWRYICRIHINAESITLRLSCGTRTRTRLICT